MKATIDRSTGIPIPNFGQHSKKPLAYFIDIIEPGVDRRFICPVNVAEFANYLIDVVRVPPYEYTHEFLSLEKDSATDHIANFLNEKSKDWVEVDQDNEPIKENLNLDKLN